MKEVEAYLLMTFQVKTEKKLSFLPVFHLLTILFRPTGLDARFKYMFICCYLLVLHPIYVKIILFGVTEKQYLQGFCYLMIFELK